VLLSTSTPINVLRNDSNPRRIFVFSVFVVFYFSFVYFFLCLITCVLASLLG